MFTEARKIQLIEDVLKVSNEATLSELELVLKKSDKRRNKKPSAHEFSGIWSKKDATLIEKAIKEDCEQIHPNDWK